MCSATASTPTTARRRHDLGVALAQRVEHTLGIGLAEVVDQIVIGEPPLQNGLSVLHCIPHHVQIVLDVIPNPLRCGRVPLCKRLDRALLVQDGFA